MQELIDAPKERLANDVHWEQSAREHVDAASERLAATDAIANRAQELLAQAGDITREDIDEHGAREAIDRHVIFDQTSDWADKHLAQLRWLQRSIKNAEAADWTE